MNSPRSKRRASKGCGRLSSCSGGRRLPACVRQSKTHHSDERKEGDRRGETQDLQERLGVRFETASGTPRKKQRRRSARFILGYYGARVAPRARRLERRVEKEITGLKRDRLWQIWQKIPHESGFSSRSGVLHVSDLRLKKTG